jgi:hypothetical protein
LAFSRISSEVKRKVDHIVEYNRQSVTRIKPSTIIKIRQDGTFDVLRK